ncbi:AlpA family transcriptional regulator [Pectobacterium parmentieri]|uniref:AlpA family transcriptional regulator n=3 Tax=Pectobacterium TaxID=122277 RepID=A0A8B3FPH9_PECPM|nr:AlpA family transcriptional regulator [Pectobacterium parmentieri]KGA36410.1 transcriptional regulator [Pectobacterium brasiliense]AYH21399.1 AlpA family transcriptional regulator [Pectobacterium parmentieri]AYH38791.1 AlpA family transcriptional regulator [Pectobacterium parmentieri]AZS59014.1 AlpA family transcriptional regulator [Pectobacterium parmentieri]
MMTDITLIRLSGVMKKTGLRKSWIYLLMKQGEFPQTVKIGARSVAWVESEVNDWIAARISQRGEVKP